MREEQIIDFVFEINSNDILQHSKVRAKKWVKKMTPLQQLQQGLAVSPGLLGLLELLQQAA
jgi:hypothetical protein